MLEVSELYSGYDTGNVLQGMSFKVDEGEIVSLIGRNGVGKSTCIKTIIGELATRRGNIFFQNQEISKLRADQRAHAGIGYVPQGRFVFPQLTVKENILMGQFINKSKPALRFDLVYSYFPILKERLTQKAGTLSGGQQQMLAIARALVSTPFLLLLDEPSEGVQPSIVKEIGEAIVKLNHDEGLTVLAVEQNLDLMQSITQRAYVVDKGSIITHLKQDEIQDTKLVTRYLAI